MSTELADLNLNRRPVYKKWQELLISRDISNFSVEEVNNIDETIGLFDNEQHLLATGSIAGNVLKYIAIKAGHEENGAIFNQIVTELTNRLVRRGFTHFFVFTKPEYSHSFKFVGFQELASSRFGVVLEKGTTTITDYLMSLPHSPNQAEKSVAAIVMHANPFTLGHQFLVRKAAQENDLVYVFVVKNDASLFSTEERMRLVQEGTKEWKNVFVVSGADYLVSYATFPAYFLKTPDDVIKYQTTLDARIFRDLIAPALNIKKRYLGTEPFSHTTGIYNQTLLRELPPAVQPIVLERKKSAEGKLITATEVRMAIKERKVENISHFIPQTTMTFIKDNIDNLEKRIKKGMKISGN
ncbi:citrate lyase synthetase [Ligilactobacillus salitolerans]|uniref:[Citrate [pro-3S]-lyase] ligase n=1 Tax=Ligilactobacillus salitolerans TaxID=1808352 RepID=A0A401IUR8_9LACO|nr:[citrate (pro-3S)-lyase] ligase [Ligilactobacillus salitolerans]GBG95255.1 citrate lyase synthetase [Ligilactobacillus salitolerans]